MKPLVLFCLLSLPFNSEGDLINSYEPSMPGFDSIFPPRPYDSFKEELVVDQVLEESSDFRIKARNVKQWLRLRLDNLYLLGIGRKEVNLVSMYKLQTNMYQVHEYPIAMPYEVSCGVMFKTRQTTTESYEGVVLLALKSPRPIVSVYKIERFKLHHIIDWRRDHSIHSITYFKWHHEDRFIIFEERKNVSIATVYGFEFDNHAPHFWHIEMLSLGITRGSPAVGHIGGDTLFLATIQDNAHAVNLYAYKKVCAKVSGSKFDLAFTIPELNAKKIEFIRAYGFLYLIVSGSPSVLFRITPDGYLMRDVIFGTSVEMIALPVKSDRYDTILLGKSSDGTPHVYTFMGNMWGEKLIPKCLRNKTDLVELKDCIGGNRSWEGATYIDQEGDQYPILLFADRHHSGELYHLPFSYIRIPIVEESVNPYILGQLETYWNRLRTSLKKLTMARSQEGSSQSISSFCTIEKEVNEMHKGLLKLKMPLDLADCSTSVYQMDVTSSENDDGVADKAPIETITFPNKNPSEHNMKTQEKPLRDHLAPLPPRIQNPEPSHLKGVKTIPIDPEMSNDAWGTGSILNEQHDGFEESYNRGRR